MATTFLNRSDELLQIEKLIEGRKQNSVRFIHCETGPATGLTSFLKFSSLKFKSNYYTFYIDGNYKITNSLSSQILLNLFNNYPAQVEGFKEYFLKKHPNDSRALGSTFFNLIPYAGSFAKDYLVESIDLKDVPQIQSTAYPSIIAELLCPFLNQISRQKPVLIFIDNAQELDDWSLDIFRSSISEEFGALKYVMGFVNRKNGEKNITEEVLWKVKSLGVKVDKLNFAFPSKALVKEFYSFKGIRISDANAGKIIETSDGNIYKILAYVNNDTDPEEVQLKLTTIQLEVLGFLDIAKQPIRKSDIIALLANSTHLFIDSLAQAEKDINDLVKKGYISFSELPDSDIIISLNFSSHPYIKDLISTVPNSLVRAKNLYEYFLSATDEQTRYSQTELALLLYRLAKIVDKGNISKRAQLILSLSLKMGSVESANRYVDKAVLSEPTYSLYDYFVKVAFHISVRDYRQSLNLLINPPQQQCSEIRIFKILLAISYNRCRMHADSQRLLRELIDSCQYKAELSILLAYSISGHLHENNVDNARAVYINYNEAVKGASNYGYFLRNASTAFETIETERILLVALKEFEQNKDGFGYYSTLCNLGKCRCRLGKLEEAQKDLEFSYEKLKTYGFHHLHIVLNNLGICKLLIGKIKDAEIFLNKALLFASNAMPRIYNQINLALLKIYEEREGEAFEQIAVLESEVSKFTFDRVKQKFYLNATMAAYASSQDIDIVMNYLLKSRQHPDRSSKKYTEERLVIIENNLEKGILYSREMFYQLSDFCYLEYWYQNPLELLPPDILPH